MWGAVNTVHTGEWSASSKPTHFCAYFFNLIWIAAGLHLLDFVAILARCFRSIHPYLIADTSVFQRLFGVFNIVVIGLRGRGWLLTCGLVHLVLKHRMWRWTNGRFLILT